MTLTGLLLCSPESPQLELHRALSVDVLASRVVRPVGRVTQAFSDGTLVLELVRPPNGPFGFVISRGKGRPDTGNSFHSVWTTDLGSNLFPIEASLIFCGC